MKILGDEYSLVDTLDNFLTIPDCWVKGGNKLGSGHGEAKLYISSKDTMRHFYGKKGFNAKCFILKSDLLSYMYALKEELKLIFCARRILTGATSTSTFSAWTIGKIRFLCPFADGRVYRL